MSDTVPRLYGATMHAPAQPGSADESPGIPISPLELDWDTFIGTNPRPVNLPAYICSARVPVSNRAAGTLQNSMEQTGDTDASRREEDSVNLDQEDGAIDIGYDGDTESLDLHLSNEEVKTVHYIIWKLQDETLPGENRTERRVFLPAVRRESDEKASRVMVPYYFLEGKEFHFQSLSNDPKTRQETLASIVQSRGFDPFSWVRTVRETGQEYHRCFGRLTQIPTTIWAKMEESWREVTGEYASEDFRRPKKWKKARRHISKPLTETQYGEFASQGPVPLPTEVIRASRKEFYLVEGQSIGMTSLVRWQPKLVLNPALSTLPWQVSRTALEKLKLPSHILTSKQAEHEKPELDLAIYCKIGDSPVRYFQANSNWTCPENGISTLYPNLDKEGKLPTLAQLMEDQGWQTSWTSGIIDDYNHYLGLKYSLNMTLGAAASGSDPEYE
ncbi:hypothetical protein TREMEDRAFT_62100 [Tremella mesenterica DSM 1558]|uniref:uncharacterized protein n=1 Tax=Tremella mesenterica (strain ATCC 24925 / CBS 8224 / DSM 1558 / NBRC 9311 / NRRL Y-6157 / RJB 2259-6 / UBC 559-6) TaxID=578456 RepID=UPI0003F49EB9|nr:uncharacterized protein TREMEDRAFT_62100 [Tremella mesenterica DSM 1558]EIW69249.1 hypothetical protein TREMEDRAFT_62100 [Tremella mesenterica DSM 1558]